MSLTIPRPAESEYAPYFTQYVAQVPPGDILDLLANQIDDTIATLGGLTDAQAAHRYAPGKWSIKEVVGHLCEAERVFVYRAQAFAHNDATPQPGWDENLYVANANYDRRSLASLLEELRTARAATVAFFAGLDEVQLERRGVANNREYSVRALAWITAGHERHHLKIVRERYLGTAAAHA